MNNLLELFELQELGILARCLCAPLVSIRVGKVQRQGHLLCPTTSRGYLSLSMLPSSEMRLSFIGDDGEIERLAAVTSVAEDSPVTLEMIDADPSGRSFVLRVPSGKRFFWQSEKSMGVGNVLITEMNGYLCNRRTLSQLTGIRESRLNSFLCQLCNNLAASSSSAGFRPSSLSLAFSSASSATTRTIAASSSSLSASSGVRQSPRLSPRANAFKDGVAKGLTNIRSLFFSKEKHRRHDKLIPVSAITLSTTHCGSLNLDGNPDEICAGLPFTSCSSVAVYVGDKGRVSSQSCAASLSPSSSLVPGLANGGDSYHKQALNVPLISSCSPVPPILGGSNGVHIPMSSHLPIPTSTFLTPYHCPCPLRSSALQYTFTPPFIPQVSEFNSASSSTFFSMKPSPVVLSQTTISLDRVTISPIPLPVPSLANVPMPLQTSNLSSFFSDPIVHIPVMDFQSASKDFLVSAPPPVPSAGFPAVLPNFLSNIHSRGERSIDGQDTPGLDALQGLGLPGPLKGECREHVDILPFLSNSRIVTRQSDDGVDQVSESLWSTSLSSELQRFPEFSGPLLAMVPALLTSGSLPCVMNFHQERNTGTWISGSRGLYGVSCEPGITSITTSVSSVGLQIRGTDACQTIANATENVEWSKEMHEDQEETSNKSI